MGEVYRATDSKLKRDVAIKVLPAAFAADAERLARFQREAEMLAALNHPNIASIYGLEETSGGHALVMELVDGPTLADLIARQRTGMPVSEALPIARQILDALEAAHEHGIIHRDLKPANIKVREDGAVKVLDFGLAKSLEVQRSGALADSPTITSPAMTAAGIILGTAAYMSPEQARGRFVDKRTDIWAFGTVIYEMLTGTRAFDGEDVSMTLAAVMKAEPDWTALPAAVPPSLRACLIRCLQKDPRQRLRDVGDVRLVIDGAFSTIVEDRSPPARWRAWTLVGSVAALVAALWLAVAGAGSIARAPGARPVIRFEHALPGKLEFRGGNRAQIAGSPDGTRFVYNTMDGLYLHTLSDGTDRRVVPEWLATSNPTFSPDGQSLAYFDSGQIKRLALTGGAPVVVATTANPYAINWAADNAIYFASANGISRVPVDGGDPEVVIAGEKGQQLSGPQLLPDGETVLFTVYTPTASPGQPGAMIAVQSTRGGQRRVVVQSGANGKYVDGHIVYTVNNGLFAVPFDTRAAQAAGAAISLTERLRLGIVSAEVVTASFDVASNGTLFYLAGPDGGQTNQLVWVLRDGAVEPITTIQKGAFGTYNSPQLSRDGRRVLVVAESDLRIYELATGRETPLTSDRSVGAFAAWLGGEHEVAYSSSRPGTTGVMNIWRQPLDRTADAEQVTAIEGLAHLDAISPDSRTLLFHHHVPKTNSIHLLSVDAQARKNAAPRPFVVGPNATEGAVFSPDGRFVANIDGVSGLGELVIRPFPGPGPATPVSVGGAREAAWARNGELFYRRLEDDMMMAVRVDTAPTLSVGTPVELFRGSGNPGGPTKATYDVTADGARFIMSSARVLDQGSTRRPAVSVVLNWTEQLKQRAATR
jgi:hypothetical protein